MTTIKPKRICQFIEPVAGRVISTIADPAISLQQNSRAQITITIPPITRAAGGATETQDAFVKTIKLFAFVLALYALSVRRRGLCFYPWLDSSILRVKLTEIRYKVLNDRYMR